MANLDKLIKDTIKKFDFEISFKELKEIIIEDYEDGGIENCKEQDIVELVDGI